MYLSMKAQNARTTLHVLVVDEPEGFGGIAGSENVSFYSLRDLKAQFKGAEIIAKYHPDSMDQLRWSLKPVFLNRLLEVEQLGKVIYVDNDITFFNSFDFLFDMLDDHRVLITPHWFGIEPGVDVDDMLWLGYVGYFNAGFFGASKDATEILNWWAKANLFRCERKVEEGLWDDQRYLDIMPVYFEKVGVVHHQGCNVAPWNKVFLKRSVVEGEVLINGKWPVVFIHKVDQMGEPEIDPFLRIYEGYREQCSPPISPGNAPKMTFISLAP